MTGGSRVAIIDQLRAAFDGFHQTVRRTLENFPRCEWALVDRDPLPRGVYGYDAWSVPLAPVRTAPSVPVSDDTG